jgi:glycerol uptake facilitator-like aquaporin
MVFAGQRKLPASDAAAYAVMQVLGCCLGALLANAMFALPLVQASQHARTGFAQLLAEVVATSGLVLVVLGSPTAKAASWRVPAWIGAAYWFTSSTSFANPAITLGRSLSDTFAGIRPADVPAFVAAQLVGGLLGAVFARLLRVEATTRV